MDKKTIFITESQYKEIYETVLRESLIVNIDLVKSIVKYLNKHFKPVKYDDINADGEVVQPYAIQMLSMDGEPLQTISVDCLLGKVDNRFCNKIKNEDDRYRFFKQVVDDWIQGNISKEGILSVNVIKEKKTLNRPTYLGEIIDISFRDLLKTPLVENNHHVTNIDSYVSLICERFYEDYYREKRPDNFTLKFTEKDFSHIPHKFFTECNIYISYKHDNDVSGVKGGYNRTNVVVEEDTSTKNNETLKRSQRIFNRVFFEIRIDIVGNSFDAAVDMLETCIGHEMTHALQHINMKKDHNDSFTDKDYVETYSKYTVDADDDSENMDILKGRLASFLYYTDSKEIKAYISEFYNEIGYIEEQDIESRESINKIIQKTRLWEIIKIMGARLRFYNNLDDIKTKEQLISYYNQYFPKTPIDSYRTFKRKMNGRWDEFYCGLTNKMVNMIREKVKNSHNKKIYGYRRPTKLK